MVDTLFSTSSYRTGIFAGICVDNKDPLNQGRIRVEVPRLLGPRTSGWAFPAWPMGDLVVWPDDRLPKIGQGVWVFNEADRIHWFAVYGPVDRPVTDDLAAYDTLRFDMDPPPVMPLDVLVDVTGRLTSKVGPPNPPPVVVELLFMPAGTVVASTEAQPDGAFSISYARPLGQDAFLVRFNGIPPFPAVVSGVFTPPSPPNTSTVVWTVPPDVWLVEQTVSGTVATVTNQLASDGGAIRLMVRDVGGPWVIEASGTVSAKAPAVNGTWSFKWTRSGAHKGPIEMKVVFPGTQLAGFAESAVQSRPAVSLPVSMTLNHAMVLGRAGTVSGIATAGALYGVPPGPAEFQVKPSGGSWSVVGTSIINSSNGSWSRSYTPTNAVAEYRVRCPASGVYAESFSDVVSTNLGTPTTTTTISATQSPTMGQQMTLNGTVRDQYGATVSGTVQAQWRYTTGPNTGVWNNFGSAVTLSAGAWTVYGNPAKVGPLAWRANYSGNSYNAPSTSAETTAIVALPAVSLVKGTVTHSSAALSWTAIDGASAYETTKESVLAQDSAATSYTASSLIAQTNYSFQTRAKAQDNNSVWVYGPYSSIAKMNTGRAGVTSSGGLSRFMRPLATNTWRSSDGWGFSGDDVLQGYFSSAAASAFGTCTYDGADFQNWVRTTYGQAVLDNLTFTDLALRVYRTSAGTGSAVSQTWYVSGAIAGQGGQPPLAGGQVMGTHTQGDNPVDWDRGLPPHWGKHVLLNENVSGAGICRSFVMYRHNSSDYSRYAGMSDKADAMNIYVAASWNFTSVADIAAAWY